MIKDLKPEDKAKKGTQSVASLISKSISLSDEMALERTSLALERTLLSYLRAAVALVLAGLTIVSLVSQTWFLFVGIAIIPLGLGLGVFGIIRSIKVNKKINATRVQH